MQQQQAPYGRHAGLGTANAPQNIAPINIAAPEAPVAEKYSLFLGNISENVDDFWLDKILSVRSHPIALSASMTFKEHIHSNALLTVIIWTDRRQRRFDKTNKRRQWHT